MSRVLVLLALAALALAGCELCDANHDGVYDPPSACEPVD